MVQYFNEQQKQVTYEFNINTWQHILHEAKKAGAMSFMEFKRIKNTPAAKIVAATAYLAGCPNPDQIAVLRVIDILSAIRNKKLFNQRPGQSISERLLPGKCYPSGVEEVINTAFILLELISLNDHLRDQKEDKKKGKYNPVTTKIISFYNNRNALLAKLQQYPEIVDKYQALFKTNITIIDFWFG